MSANHLGSFQSFGLVPETTIWMRICPAAGLGIGASLIVTEALLSTIASFMLADDVMWREMRMYREGVYACVALASLYIP